MTIEKPIFIIGVARSGTSILYKLFTRHKDTAFPEHFSDKYYSSPWKFRLIPLMLKQQIMRYKIRPEPHEGMFWQKFFSYGVELDESDVNEQIEKYIYNVINTQLKAFNANRFVNKQIDFCLRLKFLNKIFPDAYYINISREPKAIVSSLYTKMREDWEIELVENNYHHGYKGWHTIKEKYGPDVSKLEACINYFKHYKNSLQTDLAVLNSKVINVKYEEFINQPKEELKKIFEFTELDWYDDLKNEIPNKLELKNNEKWHMLPDNERQILENSL